MIRMTRRSYAEDIATMKTDIEYIKQMLDENKEQHKEILATFERYADEIKESLKLKADKDEFYNLRDDYAKFKNELMWKIIALSIGVIGSLGTLLVKFVL